MGISKQPLNYLINISQQLFKYFLIKEVDMENKNNNAYWKANIRLIIQLLIVWFIVSFGAGIIFVDFLDQFHIGGYPLGFFFAEQGSFWIFVLLIIVYSYKMNQLDKQFDVEE